jgi:hypothetical protein
MAEKVAYLVHDLTDAAVQRRIRMLQLAGAEVSLAGFRRGAVPAAPLTIPSLDLGQTADARLVSRAASVARMFTQISGLKGTIAGAEIVIARNLEMLAIASRARSRFAPDASLVYECLDIHRLLLAKGPAGKFLRALESMLWRDVDTLVTSSAAFVEHYFSRRRFPGAIEIVENKVIEEKIADGSASGPKELRHGSPPWKIGFFGMLRCAKSLRILKDLARKADGKIEVILRGKFSPAVFPNIEAELKDAPHVRFLGPYKGEAELEYIYREVHFAWAIDFYEESQNSSWLLPNRLYESSYFGAVPIALAHVATGQWLKRQGAGVLLRERLEDGLHKFFAGLDSAAYERLARQVHRIPRSALTVNAEDCRRLVALLGKKRSGQARESGVLCASEEAR